MLMIDLDINRQAACLRELTHLDADIVFLLTQGPVLVRQGSATITDENTALLQRQCEAIEGRILRDKPVNVETKSTPGKRALG